MIDWKKVGEDFGRRLAEGMIEGMSEPMKDIVRKLFETVYGACARCAAPLAGPSPSQLCADCHAAIILEQASGEEPAVEA